MRILVAVMLSGAIATGASSIDGVYWRSGEWGAVYWAALVSGSHVCSLSTDPVVVEKSILAMTLAWGNTEWKKKHFLVSEIVTNTYEKLPSKTQIQYCIGIRSGLAGAFYGVAPDERALPKNWENE